MAPTAYFIFALGLLLELMIFWRAWRALLWRRYPFFYFCLGCLFFRAIALFVLVQLRSPIYGKAYWISEAVALVLWFFVPWEVFRQLFASVPALRRIVGQFLLLLLMGLTTAGIFTSKSPGLFFADLERKAGVAQATLLVATLLVAGYYAVPLGRNLRGVALGFGMYVSVSIMNFAALELMKSFYPYWRFIRPLSFIGTLGMWTWALWSYAPNPRPATAALEVYERGLAHWAQAWSDVRAALRKAVGL